MSIFRIKNFTKFSLLFFVFGIFIFPINHIRAQETPQEIPETWYFSIFSSDLKPLEYHYPTEELCETKRKETSDAIASSGFFTYLARNFSNAHTSTKCYRQGPALETKTNYTLLAPLPLMGKTFESDPDCTTDSNGVETCKNPCAFGKYLNIMIKLIIGIAAVLSMVMIIKGGFEYMASSLPSEKESGKGTITNAIFGLLLALGAWIILYTINPNLLNFCNIGTPIKVEQPATTPITK